MNRRPASGAGDPSLFVDGKIMELKLYDTLKGGEPQPFKPDDPRRVRMYVCGPTIYDYAHIGNARPLIVFDLLFRLLRLLAKRGEWDAGKGKTEIVYVRNVTDVDDKINARAGERNISIRQLTDETYANFRADVAALGCLRPTFEPRATEHIEEMKVLIERLVGNGHAYVASDHVLFDVNSMPDYGKLSKRSLNDMIAGARVEIAPFKRDPMDFVLWKPSKPGEPSWPSPSGIAAAGRPGWHIECSAMSWKYLGETFDIHGGGVDLVFPHHENEVAQSRCAFHTEVMANNWMHNGFLQVAGEKMSKSLGNFITIRDLTKSKMFGGKKWSGDILRVAMLQTHYRQPIDWTINLLEQTEVRLERWKAFSAERTMREQNVDLMEDFLSALADDLNTPRAFAILDHAISRETASDQDRYTVYKILEFLGLKRPKARVAVVVGHSQNLVQAIGNFSKNDWDNFIVTVRNKASFRSGAARPETKLFASLMALSEVWLRLEKGNTDDVWPQLLDDLKRQQLSKALPPESEFELWVRRLISARNDARKVRNFAESDRIRNELLAKGVVLEDSKEGTTWKLAQ
jgi:cysteinyl-tRNA synthetase